MAYAALVSLAQTIDQLLNYDLYSIFLHETQEIISIYEYVIFLQAFLEDFSEKAITLEGRIRDVANEAEDIIQYFLWKQIQLRFRLIKWTVGLTKVEFKHQLKNVAKAIDSIAGEAMDIKNSFRITDMPLDDSPAASSSSRLTPTGKNDVVGIKDDLIAIKARLSGESSKLQVIPILGMGGIGKTTLARNAYDDLLTMEHFQIRAWITISQDYSVREILSCLLVSMEVSDLENVANGKESMAEKVYKTLKGRRYLIVMDDMWSTKAWDDVRNIFPDDDNGSRILLTTRLSDVAAYADSCSPPHEMRFMDADRSWDLLRQKVFRHEDCPPELENIGKRIARSCSGLPVAIVLIAGLLSTVNKTLASWSKIAQNVNAVVAIKDGQFEKILSLSYSHLPPHLRLCFLYMGGFPENYEIHASKLMRMWIAEGFVTPSVSNTLEEAAEEYLEDLVKRSLIFVNERRSNGNIKTCSIHDLVQDLCIRKAHEEKFLQHVRHRYVLQERTKNQRRISIAQSDLSVYVANFYGSSIRTIICYQCHASSPGFLGHFRLLKVLDVVDLSDFCSFPDQLFDLFHLRYLAFSCNGEVPAAIARLQNLQTIIFGRSIRKRLLMIGRLSILLPLEIWMMPQLRHLLCSDMCLLPYPEGETFPPGNLQTLLVVRNFICTERILKMIPNLKKLEIIYFGDEHDHRDYLLKNLVYLHQLENLKLEMHKYFPFRGKLNPVFPRMLKKLTLSGWGFPWNDMKIVGSLPNLEVLKLRDSACDGDTWETTEEEFPELKFLLIEKSKLQHWITESSHFPRLERLVLHGCRYLREIPDSIGDIPTLELIEVDDLNISLVDSAKRIQEDQQSYGNDALQFRFIQSSQSF